MSELRERVVAYNKEVKDALQAVYSDLIKVRERNCCVTPPSAQCSSDMV